MATEAPAAAAAAAGGENSENEEVVVEEPKIEPAYGTLEWLYWWGYTEGLLPTPINITITGSIYYTLPELKWYNFEVFPHKIKMTNTGYTVNIAAKWKHERPYLEGGPFSEKHIFGQIHFHWGPDMLSGSEHWVDKVSHVAEMQISFFKSEYMTPGEAMKHVDGLTIICYMIRFSVSHEPRLAWVLEGFPRIQEAGTLTRIGPRPMADIMPMFNEDYFVYWGALPTVRGEKYAVRWLVPRKPLYADDAQIRTFCTLWDPWDEPNMGNARPIQEKGDRHVFLINKHYNLYNSLLPMPLEEEQPLTQVSNEYKNKLWMFPARNASLVERLQQEKLQEEKRLQEEAEKAKARSIRQSVFSKLEEAGKARSTRQSVFSKPDSNK